MIEDQDYKRYCKQMDLPYYVPIFKEPSSPGITWNALSGNAPSDDPSPPTSFSQEDADRLASAITKIFLLPFTLLFMPLILADDVARKARAFLVDRHSMPLPAFRLLCVTCVAAPLDIASHLFLGFGPITWVTLAAVSVVVMLVDQLVIHVTYIFTGT